MWRHVDCCFCLFLFQIFCEWLCGKTQHTSSISHMFGVRARQQMEPCQVGLDVHERGPHFTTGQERSLPALGRTSSRGPKHEYGGCSGRFYCCYWLILVGFLVVGYRRRRWAVWCLVVGCLVVCFWPVCLFVSLSLSLCLPVCLFCWWLFHLFQHVFSSIDLGLG